ncbi:MAG: hypothetical protein ABIQ56_01760 [Chitinophagaceae bacterium]
MPPEKINEDIEMADKYTSGEDKVAESVRLRYRNRNTDKERLTGAGGYRQ